MSIMYADDTCGNWEKNKNILTSFPLELNKYKYVNNLPEKFPENGLNDK